MVVPKAQPSRLLFGKARAAVDGLTPLELQKPRADKTAIEAAMGEFLAQNDAPARPLRWFADARSARQYLSPRDPPPGYWSAYWSDRFNRNAVSLNAAWEAGDPYFHGLNSFYDAGQHLLWFSGLLRLPGPPFAPDTRMSARTLWTSPAQLPMIDAFTAGLYYYGLAINEVVCIPRPSLWILNNQLHREDGPAVEWPTGERYFFWHGVRVADCWIEHPDRITLDWIRGERIVQRRNCMIHYFGIERFLREAGAKLIDRDRHGKLWRVEIVGREDYCVIEVENGTLNPAGKRSRHFLCVPPLIQSAHQAVAWTYGLRPEQYHVAVRT